MTHPKRHIYIHYDCQCVAFLSHRFVVHFKNFGCFIADVQKVPISIKRNQNGCSRAIVESLLCHYGNVIIYRRFVLPLLICSACKPQNIDDTVCHGHALCDAFKVPAHGRACAAKDTANEKGQPNGLNRLSNDTKYQEYYKEPDNNNYIGMLLMTIMKTYGNLKQTTTNTLRCGETTTPRQTGTITTRFTFTGASHLM